MRFFLILLFFLCQPFCVRAASGLGLVKIPVADVRSSSGTLPKGFEYDPLEETQILYNEPVKIIQEYGGWLKIEAMDQPEYTHGKAWQGYPGWVEGVNIKKVRKILPANLVIKSKTARLYKKPSPESKVLRELSMGTRLLSFGEGENDFWKIKTPEGKTAWIKKENVRLSVKLPEENARKLILASGTQLLGLPYFWGGRSASAVDCSGFVNLIYGVAGIEIPRDSHEQFMKSEKITLDKMKPGDLIFSASKEKPDKVTHVAVFVDSMTVLEAPKTGEVVHTIPYDKKYGPDSVIYFGTYFGKD